MKIRTIVICLLLMGAIAAFIISSVRREKALEEETSAFASDTVSAIAEDWNPDALIHRAEPGLVKAMDAQGQNISDLFRVWQKLGPLAGDPDCHLKDTSQFEGTGGSYITASYSCDADFDKGPATLLITLRSNKADGVWKIYYINISSPYFSKAGYRPTK